MRDYSLTQTCIGLFFTPFLNDRFEILARSSPFDDVPTQAGFKTHPDGHVDLWREFGKKRSELRAFPYEYFPRGRVNWREEDGAFLFIADKIVFEKGLHTEIGMLWGLSSHNVQYMLDPHYTSPSFEKYMINIRKD